MPRLLLPLLLALPALADPPPGEPVDVRRALGSGAVVNWTRLVVEAEASRVGTGVAGRQEATEQRARQQIGPAILEGLPDVAARADVTIGDLLERPELGDTLENRVKRWAISEAHYHASGRVTLFGELDLADYLRPWTLTLSRPTPSEPTPSEHTGLVVDARGTGALPAFAPRLLADDGELLWGGALWTPEALQTSPAVWVSDAAHPATVRAGDDPLVVRARRARGADLTLDHTGSGAVRAHLLGTQVLGRGRVVILVDP
jgi:hypothetical protein